MLNIGHLNKECVPDEWLMAGRDFEAVAASATREQERGMNREGTADWPAHEMLAAQDLLRRHQRALSFNDYRERRRRETMWLAALWLFIGIVAAYDTYLSIKYQETLRFQELNPLGQWLLHFDGGSVAIFMGCKFLGTLIALGTILLLFHYKRRMGLTVATALASVQLALMMYLTFG
jgi:hypothetical protein